MNPPAIRIKRRGGRYANQRSFRRGRRRDCMFRDDPDAFPRQPTGERRPTGDPSRNPDGSPPVTTPGRPLYVHIWYPAAAHPTQPIRYTWNNPIYNQNPGGTRYPGLPDTPPLTFTGSTSAHAIAEDAPLAHGRFPLLVATHGYEV